MADNAVSPVIGVILIVVITVILAAVIAAFVFHMAGFSGNQEFREQAVQFQNDLERECSCIRENLTFCVHTRLEFQNIDGCLKIVCSGCFNNV